MNQSNFQNKVSILFDFQIKESDKQFVQIRRFASPSSPDICYEVSNSLNVLTPTKYCPGICMYVSAEIGLETAEANCSNIKAVDLIFGSLERISKNFRMKKYQDLTIWSNYPEFKNPGLKD